MTYDDDFIRLAFPGGARDLSCAKNGIDWPPPPFIEIAGFRYRLAGISQLSDAQRAATDHVARGALYVPVDEEQ